MLEKIKGTFRHTFFYRQLHKMYRKKIMAKEAKNYPFKRKRIIENYSQSIKYLNVGDGRFARTNWRLLDYAGDDSNYNYRASLIDYNINLLNLEPWPLKDNSFDIVYSSHCLEHLTMESIEHSFRQIQRILKPAGIFRLTVPDIDCAYEAFLNEDLAWFETNANAPDKSSIYSHFLNFFSNKNSEEIDKIAFRNDFEKLPKIAFLNKYINQKIDMANHRFEYHASWINFDLVEKLGSSAGFSQIIKSSRRQSISEELRDPMFDHKPGNGNLYADLIK